MKPSYQANVSLWLNCNLKCPYCFGNPSPPPEIWPEQTAERLGQLEHFLQRTGRWSLDMSGGELTIYPGFADFCNRLAAAGHQVMFFTNGTLPLAESFPPERIRAVSRVTLSYQVAHERVARYDRTFEDNIDYLLGHGVDVAVNYVLYPKRKDSPAAIRKRFDRPGVQLQFRAFQGEYDKRQYPFAYSAGEKAAFAKVGDLRALFLMEHGYYLPTFKPCRAGYQTFYLSFRTGGIYACEQLQQRQLANFAEPDAAEAFRSRLAPTPPPCPAKRCTCRLTLSQENFLATHDVWDMANYAEWGRLSLPTAEAVAHWNRVEKAFADELSGRLRGDNLFLWGGGVHTLMLLRLLREQRFPMASIQGIIDSNDLKHGQEILGIPIVSREHFEGHGAARCSDILVSSRAFEEEICRDILMCYDGRFNLIRLYDGSMTNRYEALENGANF
jgi:pyruvate-formate lyase-activating enzyme